MHLSRTYAIPHLLTWSPARFIETANTCTQSIVNPFILSPFFCQGPAGVYLTAVAPLNLYGSVSPPSAAAFGYQADGAENRSVRTWVKQCGPQPFQSKHPSIACSRKPQPCQNKSVMFAEFGSEIWIWPPFGAEFAPRASDSGRHDPRSAVIRRLHASPTPRSAVTVIRELH